MIGSAGVITQAKTFHIPAGDVTALYDAILFANNNNEADIIILGVMVSPPTPPIGQGDAQPQQPPIPPSITHGSVYTLSSAADPRIPFGALKATALPIITSEITIHGNNATLQRDPQLSCKPHDDVTDGEFRILEIKLGGNLILEDLTIKNGCATILSSTGARGGGLLVKAGATLELARVTVVGNEALTGGGIGAQEAVLTIFDSSIYDNVANGGGGISTVFDVSLRIVNTTISGNSAIIVGGGLSIASSGRSFLNETTITNNIADKGGGISVVISSTLETRNTIVAGNIGPEDSADCAGALISLGYNLIGTLNTSTCALLGETEGNIIGEDPQLGPLQDNGGATLTHALLPGSPAIDAGDCVSGEDQRGEIRPKGAACDIGAFEANEDTGQMPPPSGNRPPSVELEFSPQNPTDTSTILLFADASDPDGDSLTYEWLIDNNPQPQLQGSTAEWENPPVGEHIVMVSVSDGNGGVGLAEVAITVRSATSPQISLAEALDVNNNGRLDDAEILSAIQFWISGRVVPGTDETISDSEILELIQLWISGSPI